MVGGQGVVDRGRVRVLGGEPVVDGDDPGAGAPGDLRGQAGVTSSNIVFAGESAGGGLAIATMVNARDRGLPLPAAALLMSPYVDLTLAGATLETRHEADPLLSRELLQPRVADYTSGQDPARGLISPVYADLAGLPPLIIQAGTHEVLLDDACALARAFGTAGIAVELHVVPEMPHVWPFMLPAHEASQRAFDDIARFVRDITGSGVESR